MGCNYSNIAYGTYTYP